MAYEKVTGHTTKVISPRSSMPMISGGGSGDSRGGSSRSYPKKSGWLPANSTDAPFNPQKVAASKKYVGGVGV